MGLGLLALTCLVGAAFAGPFARETSNRCSLQCSEQENGRFSFEVGKKYVYRYRGGNYLGIAHKLKQNTTIRGLVEIHVLSKCELVLKLKEINLEEKATAAETRDLIRRLEIPVPFAFDNGKIENVCPSPEEVPQSLNIKKGILSTLINTMSNPFSEIVKEDDSLGTCVTKYTAQQGRSTQIRKEKNLKSCTQRHSSVTALITSPYDSPNSNVHAAPIFPGETLICTQDIERGTLFIVSCVEEAELKPLKEHDDIIKFEGVVELVLSKVENAEPLTLHPQRVQESLKYNLQMEQDQESSEKEVEQILQQMCSKNIGVVDVGVSKSFFKLISLVKKLQSSSLDKIYNSLKDGKICSSKKVRHIFLDTLPMAGTEDAIELMIKVLVNKEISGLKAKVWPASLALIPKPTERAVAAVIPLLRNDKSGSVLLGVSVMVYRFCAERNCERSRPVQEIVSVLNQAIGSRCSSEKDKEVISLLKAFGNMGFVGEAESNILACAKDSDKPVGLRLAAIDAFRRLDKKRPQGLLKLYEDQRENFEIRIAAVSSIMKKADAQQIEVIKRVAEQENDVQVSSYISTLMTNIKKSSSPLKKNVRKLLREMEIQSPPVGYLENSKNIEVSAFSETFNIGGEVEADIIHCSDTKIPRSINTRFDVNVFDKNINLFEFGVRAEGLEAAFKKILGRKDASKQKSSAWNLLRSRKFLNDEETEVSLFVRTMNTEIFDLSASDLTGVGEMVKIADVMEKLAEGKSVDFSHSFLFLNTHLIIPSVTGRSYTFGLTGSATVGLTATQKLDVLQFPRRADIQAHFQPSVNVEVAATVGIQTSVPRPDMRVVTRLHLESDTQAQFRIKDGRQVLARFNVPSENVVFAKISSDIFEVDAQQNEKRVFKAMQKKIDYCFNKLEKPLGVSICGKWEVPRPFLTRTFPFIRGVGSVEFAVKKSDQEMKGLELSVEIPKRLTEVMHYKASLDTPGSQMSRRFAAELEVQQPDSKQMKFSLDLTSPFKNARATGSYNLTPEVVSGALELHTSSSQIVSINVSSEISETRSRKVLKTSLEVSVSNRQPVIVEGIIDITKGRKQQISLDLKSNKPTEKPISIQGMIIKEGRLDLQNSEWKMTSDVKVKSPFWNTQVLLEAEKQTKQTQTLSTSVAVHYQKDRLQKQTIKLAGKLQRNSNKVNTYIQFETTQYPAANWNLNWNFQGKLRETMKNDISLKYGGNPERTYVNVLQSCRSDGWRNGEFQLSVKAPQLGIDNDVKVSRVLEPQNIKMEANIRYKADRRIKTLINLDKVSEAPVQIKVNAELEYPGRKLILQDEIVEISPNAYQGDLVLQWQQDKQAELKYKYQNLNKESKYHQEIEASLRLPNRQNQIKSKATFQLMQDSLYLENQLILNRNSQYLVRTHLKRTGVSHMDLKTPKIDAKLKLINDDERKAAAIDVKFKTRRSQHITATVGLDLGQKTKVEIEATLDADRRPYKKFYVSAEVEKTQSRSGNLYKCSCKLECSDILNIQFTGSGDLSVLGKHDVSLDATVRNLDPIKLIIRQELTKHFIKTSIKVSKRNIDKALIELEGAFQKRSRETEISTKFSLKALDSSFETKELEVKYMFSRTSSSSSIKSEMRLQRCPGKVYAGEIECDMKSSSMQLKASAQTPHINFEKQSLSISFQRSNSAMLSIVQVQLPNRKEMSISSDVKKTRYGLIASSVLSSPFEAVRNAKVLLSLDTQAAKNSLMTYIDVNEKRVYDMELRKTVSSQGMEMDAQVKIPCRKFQSISLNMRRVGDSFMSSCNMELEKNKVISLQSGIERKPQGISISSKIGSPFNRLKDAEMSISLLNSPSQKTLLSYINVNSQRKALAEVSYKSMNRGAEILSSFSIKNHSVSGIASLIKQTNLLTYSLSVHKGSQSLLPENLSGEKTGNKRLHSMQRQKISLVDVTLSKETSAQNSRFVFKAQAPFMPLSLTVQTTRNDSNSLSADVQTCFGSEQKACYNAKFYQIASVNSDNYRQYRKITCNIEKLTRSKAEPFGNIVISYGLGDNDFKSKLNVEILNKRLGYEVKLHRRHHEREPCSMETELQLMNRTVIVRSSALHNSEQLLIDFDVTPDATVPTRKYRIEVKKHHSQRDNEISGHLKLSNPNMIKPISLEVSVRKGRMIPVEAKISLQYAASPQKVLTLEIQPEGQNAAIKLYSEDRKIDAMVKFLKDKTENEDKYGYEWRYKSKADTKRGGVAVVISQRRRGIPMNVDVLEELKNIAKFFYDRSLSEIEEEIIKHIKDFWYNVIKPKLEDFLDWYQEQLEKVLDSLREALSLHFPLWDEIVNLVKDLLSYLKTFLKELPHIRSLKEFLEDLKKFWDSVIHRILGIIFEHVPDVVKDIWQMTRADLKNCLEKICRPGSICDDLRQIYENSKAKGVLNYLLNKISEKRRSLMELLPQGLPDIKDLIRKAIRIAESQIKRIFGDLVGEKIISVVKGDILEVESFLRGRVIELIDNIMKYIDDLLESDEDLQLLKSVMQETKQNAVNAWQNREKIAREMWQPVRVRDLKHTLNNG
ncbi:uncharacterized protein LOC118181423 isoform X2 [Stegodyphus dumicola]|uniref:uncharacterized protein LOC118181423 isoform X2 n=1 Tax=Stegodyphus dumicola TaxID=202533 RepID=UPI0015B2C0DC|nr:uncharacterized protein LOC118181423 isoform X2 [Stegodyphus dumicola]